MYKRQIGRPLLTTDLEGWHCNMDLAVNLKTILHTDRRMKTGKAYQGVLRLDAECDELRYDGFCVEKYIAGVDNELCIALGGLIEEKMKE